MYGLRTRVSFADLMSNTWCLFYKTKILDLLNLIQEFPLVNLDYSTYWSSLNKPFSDINIIEYISNDATSNMTRNTLFVLLETNFPSKAVYINVSFVQRISKFYL